MCHIAKLRNIFYNSPIYIRKRTSCCLYCMWHHIKTPRISARRPQRGVEIVVYGGLLYRCHLLWRLDYFELSCEEIQPFLRHEDFYNRERFVVVAIY